MADTQAKQTIDALNAILEELRELRQQFETFSNGGFPLRQTIPTNELVAAAASAAALVAREGPAPSPQDVQRRLQLAMLISRELIIHYDQFQQQTQPQQLENLSQR